MAETAAYPYATHLDVKFDPLTLIDVSSLAKTVTDQWYNQTLCKVNESVIRSALHSDLRLVTSCGAGCICGRCRYRCGARPGSERAETG